MILANEKGFTLLEMMLIVFLIGVLSAIAVPRLEPLFSRNKLRGSTSSVTSTLYLARMKAINEGANHGVEFFADGTFDIVRDPFGTPEAIGASYRLDEGISFAEVSFVNWLAVFNEQGQIDKNCLFEGETLGVIRITDGAADTTRVEITMISGRIKEYN